MSLPDPILPHALTMDLAPALAQLQTDGYGRLGRVLAEPALAMLRERALDLMMGRVDNSFVFFQLDSPTGEYGGLEFGQGYQGPSERYRKMEKLERDPLFRTLLENALFRRVVEARGGRERALFRMTMFSKAPQGGTDLPWHQDGGRFWGIDRDATLQFWCALDDAPEAAGCLQVVPGTHLDGLVTPNGGQIKPEKVEAARAAERAVALPAVAGEVILIHNQMWHRSGLNKTDHFRRGLSICLMDVDTRCTRKKHAPREFVRLFETP